MTRINHPVCGKTRSGPGGDADLQGHAQWRPAVIRNPERRNSADPQTPGDPETPADPETERPGDPPGQVSCPETSPGQVSPGGRCVDGI